MVYDPYYKTTIVDMWLRRDTSKRCSDSDILSFHTELEKEHSELIQYLRNLSPNSSDTYQTLKSFLRISN